MDGIIFLTLDPRRPDCQVWRTNSFAVRRGGNVKEAHMDRWKLCVRSLFILSSISLILCVSDFGKRHSLDAIIPLIWLGLFVALHYFSIFLREDWSIRKSLAWATFTAFLILAFVGVSLFVESHRRPPPPNTVPMAPPWWWPKWYDPVWHTSTHR